MTAPRLMDVIGSDPNVVADRELGPFVKDSGDEGTMVVGDRFTIKTAGPWSGPVEVIDIGRRHFRFATLDGHMEAGTIEFRATRTGTTLVFEIESWARSGDRAFDVLYDKVGLGKAVQTEMWVTACERASELAGGPEHPDIHISERRADHPPTKG